MKKISFFEKIFMVRDKILDQIKSACAGLIYISETDAAINVFTNDGASSENAETVSSYLKTSPDEFVEEIKFDVFFDRLTADKDWHGPMEKARVKQFQTLKKTLADNLRDIRVFKAGRIRKKIFVVGFDKDGRLAGIKTEAVET